MHLAIGSCRVTSLIFVDLDDSLFCNGLFEHLHMMFLMAVTVRFRILNREIQNFLALGESRGDVEAAWT